MIDYYTLHMISHILSRLWPLCCWRIQRWTYKENPKESSHFSSDKWFRN